MENLIQELERDIPKAEEELGSDARIVREMRRQLAELKAEGKLRDQLVFNVSSTKKPAKPTRI